MGTGYTFTEAEEVKLLMADDPTVLRALAQVINFPSGSRTYVHWGSTRAGLVHRFHTALEGIGKVYGPYAKGLFKWQTTSKKDTVKVLQRLFPVMDDARKDKAIALAERMLGTPDIIKLFGGD